MRVYDKELVNKLVSGELIEGEIIVKSIPDSEEKGVLDQRQRKYIIDTDASSNNKPPENLSELRSLFGCENYDICEEQVSVEYIDLDFRDRKFRIWIYRPIKERNDRAAVLYIHGGAFFAGRAKVFENPMKLLAQEADCVVFNIEYTLAPELKYPGQIEECLSAIEFIEENALRYGVNKQEICICGDSAGANIASAVALRAPERLSMQVLFYPVVDFVCDGKMYDWQENFYNIAKKDRELIVPRLGMGRIDGKGDTQRMNMTASLYLVNDEERFNEDVSPLYADVSRMPKTILFFCDYDGLRVSEETFFKKLKDSAVEAYGIRYLGVTHAFFEKLGILPQAEAAVYELARILNNK